MHKLIKNPLVKAIGIILILYFGLFYNKENPSSLGNRLSGENIKKGLNDVSQKSVKIIGGIKKAEEIQKREISKQQEQQNSTSENER